MSKKLSSKRKKALCEGIVMQLAQQGDIFGKPILRIKALLENEPDHPDLHTDIFECLDQLDAELSELTGCLEELLKGRALAALQKEADDSGFA